MNEDEAMGDGEGEARTPRSSEGRAGADAEEEEESGQRKVVRKLDPKMPSRDERVEHEFTHLPFRSWCRHCVRGKGKEEACRRGDGESGSVPEVAVDFMFMGEEKDGRTLAMVVAKERDSKAIMCTVTPRKSTGEWISKRLMAWTREVGVEHGPLIIKSDNEPALKDLTEKWASLRAMRGGGRCLMENSPIGSSKSNGVVERGILTVQGMIRTLRSALEERYK
jgi:hypothetical protein